MPDTYEGVVDFLDYKTIRYPGHCQVFRPMLEIGLGSRQEVEIDGVKVQPRSVLKAVLNRSLGYDDMDMVLVRLTFEGERKGAEHALVYEIVDRQDTRTGLTAMMRTTAFPASIIAQMAASGQIVARGCYPQERVVDPAVFVGQLKKRGINLVIREA